MAFMIATLVTTLFAVGDVLPAGVYSEEAPAGAQVTVVPKANGSADSALERTDQAELAGPGCPGQAYPPETSGCTVTLRTPADCATLVLPAEFAWEGDACHTPYYLQIAGNPPAEWNYNNIQITSVVNAMAWAESVGPGHVQGLYSDNGWYHWRVCNAYETGCSGTRAFRLE